MNRRDWRVDTPLARALLISAAFHAMLFWRDAGPPPATSGGSLRAHLQRAATANPPVAPAPADAAPDTRPAPQERTYDSSPPAAPSATSGAARATDAATAEENFAAEARNAGIDLGGLREYHVALGRGAARFRNYPPQARAAGWEGRVPMRLTISASGVPVGLHLIGSSGHALLDQAALEMMRMAAGHTPLPESLRGQEFSIDLAVDYNLADEQ